MPAQAQFCMGCGTPVRTPQPAARPAPIRAVSAPRKKLPLAAIAAAVAALGLGFVAWKAFGGGKVVQATGSPLGGGPLTDRSGKVLSGGPLTDNSATVTPAPRDPTDVIDYLKFLKDIERRRVLLQRSNLSDVLKQSMALTGGNLLGEMSENPEERHNQDYAAFQQVLAKMTTDWQQLSALFLSKPAPASCSALRDRYHDLLGKANSALTRVANSFSQAMSGNAGAALDNLTAMQGTGLGSASKDVGEATLAADDELGAVCDKFKLRKDFDIRDDLGGGNFLGR